MSQAIGVFVGEFVTVSSLVIAGREFMSDDVECKASNGATKEILEDSFG